MAAYHFTAKIHSRAKGASAVRAAAYRAAERLFDARLGVTEDYTRKADVVEAAILLPAGAPAWMQDRQELWNRVEGRERRKDAQVAQELEVNLPRELSPEENWRLITDFAREHLVAEGRVCDIAMHVHEAADGSSHPHAHVLMPLRSIEGDGFGDKHPDVDWRTFLDRRDRLGELRELWCSYARDRAASLGIDLGSEWDHRSFADRNIDLEAQPKLGATAQRLEGQGSPADRSHELIKAQRRNGERLLARPEIVLEAVTLRQSTFTEADIARWVHRHSADDQYREIMAGVNARMICVGRDDQGRQRYSTNEMIALESRMVREAGELATTRRHVLAVGAGDTATAVGQRLANSGLSGEQRDAARLLLEGGDLACLVGHAGAGKSTMLAELRRELEREGYNVRGAALSGIAAQNLFEGSGIEARTLHSVGYAWEAGRDPLTARDVLVIDEAGMVGSRQLSRFIHEAKEAGAKLILVGDPEQLQAIEAGAAFRAVAERCPTAELTEIRRQKAEWQREATKELATGQTAEALGRYAEAGCLIPALTDNDAVVELTERWQQARASAPDKSRIMLAHTRAHVETLNTVAREGLKIDGGLTDERQFETVNGGCAMATGDRFLFLRNERKLDVRNGTLGTVIGIEGGVTGCTIHVETDDGRVVAFDPAAYRDFAHGYATTIHKAQGVTVDEAFVLASRGFDRHLAYVAMSRHRERLVMVASDDSFPSEAELHRIMGRERRKDTVLDYMGSWDAESPELEPDMPEPGEFELPDTIDRNLALPSRRLSLTPPVIGAPSPTRPALKPPTLDYPAPKPTDDFLRQLSPERMEPAAPPLTELERMYHDMKQRELERERQRQLGIHKGRDLGL